MKTLISFPICIWISFFLLTASQADQPEKADISDLYRKAFPAVVRIESSQRRLPSDNDDMKFATGFIFDANGYILTTADIVCGAKNIHIITPDNWRYSAKIVAQDKKLNIAILKIPKKGLHTLPLGDSINIVPGTKVISITNPYGLTNTLAVGYVSGKYRSGFSKGRIENYIQTNLPLNPGDCGSPLLTCDGKVVGIMTAALIDDIPQDSTSQWMQPKGISFAIPIDFVKRNIPIMIRSGRMNHLWVGIEVQNISRNNLMAENNNIQSGILILNIFPDSPADKADLRRGDIIVNAGSTAINDICDFQAVISQTGVDKQIEITIIRDGEEIIIPIKAAIMPKNLINNKF